MENWTETNKLKKLLETGLSAASPHDIHQRAELAVFQGVSAFKRYVTSGVSFFEEFLNE
ncbi:MAG: hypothetical protein IKE65_01195 [Clostridia bacterium]|nr:hypothetical protein [Clostridia bacterium]